MRYLMIFCLLPCLLGAAEQEPAADSATPAWRQDADARILAHRTRPVTIQVINTKGEPVPEQDLQLRMTRHAFNFGTAIDEKLILETEADHPYKTHLLELFNTTVLENWHKWAVWDKPERRVGAARTVDWLLAQNLRLRGHTMVWGVTKWKLMPPDIHEAIVNKVDGMQAELLARSLQRIREAGTALHGTVYEWDVINEAISEDHHFNYLGLDHQQRIALMADWFRAAAEATPDTRLIINDFSILSSRKNDKLERFVDICARLQAAGAPITGVGFQAHHWSRYTHRDPESLAAALERFASLGLDMAVTEYDTPWQDDDAKADQHAVEQEQAERFAEFLRILFAQPRATTFMLWGFWDGEHWQDNAAFFRKDWSPKPALDVYRRLVFDEWWTDTSGTTDERGMLQLRAFYGDHQVLLNGRSWPCRIDRDSGVIRITVP